MCTRWLGTVRTAGHYSCGSYCGNFNQAALAGDFQAQFLSRRRVGRKMSCFKLMS